MRSLKMSEDLINDPVFYAFGGAGASYAVRKVIFIQLLMWFCDGVGRYIESAEDIVREIKIADNEVRIEDAESVYRACVKAGVLRSIGDGRMDAYAWLIEKDFIDYGE